MQGSGEKLVGEQFPGTEYGRPDGQVSHVQWPTDATSYGVKSVNKVDGTQVATIDIVEDSQAFVPQSSNFSFLRTGNQAGEILLLGQTCITITCHCCLSHHVKNRLRKQFLLSKVIRGHSCDDQRKKLGIQLLFNRGMKRSRNTCKKAVAPI